jgi:hypothetical protein
VTAPGIRLLELCGITQDEVFFVAPFMKSDVVSMILEAVPPSVQNIVFVTRWDISEIIAGVSDLDVYDLLKHRNGTLLLHPCLHAKYYRVDTKSLIGSANLTRKALGYCATPNVELLIEQDCSFQDLKDLEKQLREQGIRVTDNLRQQIAAQVDKVKESIGPAPENVEGYELEFSGDDNTGWLPTCPKPEKLYQIFQNDRIDQMLESTFKAGMFDIKICKVLPGLSEDEFYQYLKTQLESHPTVQKIIDISVLGITDNVAIDIIEKDFVSVHLRDLTSDNYWEILKNWLLFFFPSKFRRRPAGEILEQSREL